MSDIYPEGLRSPVDGDRDAELAILRRTLFIKKITLVIAVVTLVAVAVGFGILLYRGNSTLTAIRATQKANTPIAANTNALVAQQKDCLTQGGKCFRQERHTLLKALGSVRASNIQVSAAGAACAVSLVQSHQAVTFESTLRCLVKTLAANGQ